MLMRDKYWKCMSLKIWSGEDVSRLSVRLKTCNLYWLLKIFGGNVVTLYSRKYKWLSSVWLLKRISGKCVSWSLFKYILLNLVKHFKTLPGSIVRCQQDVIHSNWFDRWKYFPVILLIYFHVTWSFSEKLFHAMNNEVILCPLMSSRFTFYTFLNIFSGNFANRNWLIRSPSDIFSHSNLSSI